jgi:catechol 2,3-dioxygenase-like lactoylglutathione lyase family enzyme
MTVGIRHTGIVVSDIEEGTKFWVENFGFKIVSNQIEAGEFIDKLIGIENVQVNTVKLVAPDSSMIELLHFLNQNNLDREIIRPNSHGITHVAVNISNLDETLLKLAEKRYFPINKPLISPEGKHKVCYLVGFENNLIELVETLS